MDVIPFNVPGLPDPSTFASAFVTRPISIDANNAQTGPMLGLHAIGVPTPKAGRLTDGVLCIHPETEMLSYLFNIQVRSRQKHLLPGILIYSASVAGSCLVFRLSYDPSDNPVLVVTLLPEEYLPQIVSTQDGKAIVDVSGVDDRLEFTQVFTANGLGAVKRLSNDITHLPKENGNAVFDLQKDIDTISDVCSFYMTRTLALSGDGGTGPITNADAVGLDPIWQLLWKPTPWTCILGFSVVYILTRTSASFRSLNGTIAVDYNLRANRLPRDRREEERKE